MSVLPPRGLIGALVTPLNNEYYIDKPSLKSLLDYTIKDLHGVLIGAADIGEGFALSNQKRIELIKTSMEIVNGRIPLFLNITGDTEDHTAENIIHVGRIKEDFNYKGDIFLLDCPLWYHSNKNLADLYIKFGKITTLPFILYNNPHLITELQEHLKRNNIRTNVLKKLSRNEQIVGIIHIGELKRAINYAKAVRDRRHFRIYDGNELNFLGNPSLDGVVAKGANILPKQWRTITESSINLKETIKDDPTYYTDLWKAGQMLKILHEAYLPNPTAIIKSALKLMGTIGSRAVAEDTPSITPDQESRIYNLLAEYELI
ncbi:MAG: dihydrodipicolinate synthase family protein [Pseudomonadota bacterium]